MHSAPGSLTILSGEDWVCTMTYTRDGKVIPVAFPSADVRSGPDHTFELILHMDDSPQGYITQNVSGAMDFKIPASVTAGLIPGSYYWDFFGSVNDQRIKLVPISPFTVVAAVTAVSP